jgi:hypothetical protein
MDNHSISEKAPTRPSTASPSRRFAGRLRANPVQRKFKTQKSVDRERETKEIGAGSQPTARRSP